MLKLITIDDKFDTFKANIRCVIFTSTGKEFVMNAVVGIEGYVAITEHFIGFFIKPDIR